MYFPEGGGLESGHVCGGSPAPGPGGLRGQGGEVDRSSHRKALASHPRATRKVSWRSVTVCSREKQHLEWVLLWPHPQRQVWMRRDGKGLPEGLLLPLFFSAFLRQGSRAFLTLLPRVPGPQVQVPAGVGEALCVPGQR